MKALTILTLSVLLAQIFSGSVVAPTRALQKPQSSLVAETRSVWISDSKGHLKQFDLEGNLIKEYATDSEIIFSMVTTPDNKHLLYSSGTKSSYNLNQLSIETQTLEKVYTGYSGDNELPLVSSNDSKFVVAATDIGGNQARIKVYDLESKSQVGESALGFNYDLGTTGLAISKDNKSVYVGGEYGSLLEVEISNVDDPSKIKFDWVKNFSKDSVVSEDANILSMVVSEDNEWLFMSNELGYVKRFSHKDQKFSSDWGKVMNGKINRIFQAGKFLVVSDSKSPYQTGSIGQLKIFDMDSPVPLWSGVLVESGIVDMVNHPDQRILLAGGDGHVYEQSRDNLTITKDWGKVMDGDITAMTL